MYWYIPKKWIALNANADWLLKLRMSIAIGSSQNAGPGPGPGSESGCLFFFFFNFFGSILFSNVWDLSFIYGGNYSFMVESSHPEALSLFFEIKRISD